jgi:chromosomal replication initiator protein
VRHDLLPDDLTSIWDRAKEQLRDELPASTFELWISPLRAVSVNPPTLYLAAPEKTRAWVERRYAGAVESALQRIGGQLERVEIVAAGDGRAADSSSGAWSTGVESLPIDRGHTFERFVIGDGNRLAHAAALAVAEAPGEAYNPLFLHGPPGLGKTHLLGAIGNYLRRRRADLQIHYTTAERFTTEFVAALRKEGPERFKERYRALDALLIDDVQALEGKEHTQEEFVHTFNALHAAGKQIALSSDRPPEALARLADRLRDRFQWGLSAQLGPPDLKTRTTLLWRMAAVAMLDPPEPLALHELASRTSGNVRRLEGTMTRVIALSSVLGIPVTKSLVHRALGAPPAAEDDGGGRRSGDSPSVAAIQDAACSVLGISRDDLLSPARTARAVRARQLAIFMTRESTELSLAQIAREFNRDHSTVLHAIRTVTRRLEPGSEISRQLQQARELIGDGRETNQRSGQVPRTSSDRPHGSTSPPRRATTP